MINIEQNKWLIFSLSIRMGMGLILFKALTTLLSPGQYYYFGQAQGLFQIYTALTGSIASSKYSTIYANATYEKQKEIINISFTLQIALAIILVIATTAFIKIILEYTGINTNTWAISIMPIAATLIGIVALQQGIYIATERTKDYAKSIIIMSISNTAITSVLAIQYGLEGALAGITASTMIGFLICKIHLGQPKAKVQLKNLFKINEIGISFAITTIILGIANYGSQIYIRQMFSEQTSITEAGLYTAAQKMSELYMGVVAIFFTTKLIPLYAKLDDHEIIKKIIYLHKILIPTGAIVLLLGLTAAAFIINNIFDESYKNTTNHLIYIGICDLLKCIYWINIYYIIKIHKSITYFTIEISGMIVGLLVFTTNLFNTELYIPQTGQLVQNLTILTISIIIIIKHKKQQGIPSA